MTVKMFIPYNLTILPPGNLTKENIMNLGQSLYTKICILHYSKANKQEVWKQPKFLTIE